MRTNLLASTTSPRRGAARLSAIWVIVAVVLALLMAVFAFTAQDEASKAKAAQQTAETAAAEAEDALLAKQAELRPVSETFGFTSDPSAKPSNHETAKALLEEAKAAFPDMEGITTYEAAIPRMVEAYRTKLTELGQKESRVAEVQSQYETERSSRTTTVSEKDATIRELQQQLDDVTSQKDAEIARLESANDQLSSQVRSLTDEKTAFADETRLAQRATQRTEANLASETIRINQTLNDIRARAEKPDGIITAVDGRFDLAMISLNASDRLSEGIEFRVVSGQPNADPNKAKARAVVTNVGPTVSEVRIYDVADPLGQPVVDGDLLFNPLFEPKAQRDAVLAGTFSGIYNEEELRLLLAEIGINVQDEITNTTNYLITGGPIFRDDDGEPLEEPRKVEDLPEYAKAVDQGVAIISMRDVQQYFRR